jgi:FkbM family methyltransferase
LIRQLNGHHEPQEERVFHEIVESLTNPTAMIELGAYWAWYSMWFKSRHPGAVSIIVEPSPANLEAACQNINENGLRILAELGGVFPSALRQNGSHGGEHFGVPHVSVAGLMDKYGLEKLSILHADIQGAELEMLKEAEPLLAARKIDHLFVSTHWLEIHRECRDLLQSHGYRLVAEHSPEESFTIDGLIVARSPDLPPFQVQIHRRHV